MDKKAQILLTIIVGILEAIEVAGKQGAPSGVLYAASMSLLSLENFTTIVDSLKRKGYVTESNHLLVLTEKGGQFLRSLTPMVS
jgi:predicted transcriptional regulator